MTTNQVLRGYQEEYFNWKREQAHPKGNREQINTRRLGNQKRSEETP